MARHALRTRGPLPSGIAPAPDDSWVTDHLDGSRVLVTEKIVGALDVIEPRTALEA